MNMVIEYLFEVRRRYQVRMRLHCLLLTRQHLPQILCHLLHQLIHLLHSLQWVPYLLHHFRLGGVWLELESVIESLKEVAFTVHKVTEFNFDVFHVFLRA